ncbi:beta-galactosidase [Enterococcus gallinarum]|uniref:beta-galactosidase n=1 Tax=Enterococcus gallinarum TaxID=1353 RepID=UPI0039BF8F05
MKQRQHSQKLILGGEVHNSTASSIAYMEEKVWDKIDKVAINTLLIPIYWELIEPQPNQFDFSLIDYHLENAAEKKIDVIFCGLAFGRMAYPRMFLNGSKRIPNIFA